MTNIGKTHEPYMAVISVSRVQGRANLFDSEHRHQHFMEITVKTAYRTTTLDHEHIMGDEYLIKLRMSEVQWASLLSSPNIGQGVPATLTWLPGTGYIEGPATPENKSPKFKTRMTSALQKAVTHLDALLGTKLTKAQLSAVQMARQEIRSNMPFAAECFDEYMEERVQKARQEIDTYLGHVAASIGMANLPDVFGPPAIEKDTSDA